jgi:POT family proton-dependent oligopeptide transporter
MLGNDTTSLTNNDDSTNPTTIHLTSVSTIEQLQYLPIEFLNPKTNANSNNNSDRPLVHIDEHGHEYTYYLKPMTQSVLYILLIEMMERFSFYGINYTTTAYLTGEYVYMNTQNWV